MGVRLVTDEANHPLSEVQVTWASEQCRLDWLRFHFLRLAQREKPGVLQSLSGYQCQFETELNRAWGGWDPWNAPGVNAPIDFLQSIREWASSHAIGVAWVHDWAIRTLFWWSLPMGGKSLTWANPSQYPVVQGSVSLEHQDEDSKTTARSVIEFRPGRRTLTQVGRSKFLTELDSDSVTAVLMAIDREFLKCLNELGTLKKSDVLRRFVTYQVGGATLGSFVDFGEDTKNLRDSFKRASAALGLPLRHTRGRPRKQPV